MATVVRTPTRREKRLDLNRDTRLQILTMYSCGISKESIAYHLNVSFRQIEYSLQLGHPTPQKRGNKTFLTEEQVNQIINYINSSQQGRQMSFLQLAMGPFSSWNTTETVIRSSLKREGYERFMGRSKPRLSESVKQRRLEFAIQHKDWIVGMWDSIIWSDESWMTYGTHCPQWVTRKRGQDVYHTDTVLPKDQRRVGWMFWGCFSGSIKGPGLFWEKDWGTINGARYRERILPLAYQFYQESLKREGFECLFMQDNAPAHRARETTLWLEQRSIQTLKWPSNSPDLNPIEMVWDIMKDFIQDHYGDRKLSLSETRQAVEAAWESITPQELRKLVDSMPQRCQAVIDAQGGHTKY
jgi:DDE superfamily endonuclease